MDFGDGTEQVPLAISDLGFDDSESCCGGSVAHSDCSDCGDSEDGS